MAEDTCKVAECSKPIKRQGYCYGHYMKQWRYGTPTPMHPSRFTDLVGVRFGTVIVVKREGRAWVVQCDCGSTRTASAGELNRTGDASTCGDRATHYRTDSAGYSAAHQRVRTDRGRVSNYACVDCGKDARHWSYNHDDPDELYAEGVSLNPVAYSLKPEHYSPRCVSCHKRHDLDRIDAAKGWG